ncbi:MAG: hypothetical protein QXF22_05245 [Thermoplasmata archaeon]
MNKGGKEENSPNFQIVLLSGWRCGISQLIIVDWKESEECLKNTISYLYFGDYTTLWNRINKIKLEIIIPEKKEFVESDGTGLKA